MAEFHSPNLENGDVNLSFSSGRTSPSSKHRHDVDSTEQSTFSPVSTGNADTGNDRWRAANIVPLDPSDGVRSDRVGLYQDDVRTHSTPRQHDSDNDSDDVNAVVNNESPAVLNVSVQDVFSARKLNKNFADRVGDDSLDTVLWGGRAVEHRGAGSGVTAGLDNEAYDGDEETFTDVSFHNTSFQVNDNPAVIPFPDSSQPISNSRPSSGRYQKNPALERNRPASLIAQGPYDPNNRVFLSPLPTKTPEPTEEAQRKRRIPRPPSKLKMKCAYFWSCFACLIGNFLCAIPALRYTVTANESRKIGDYNSAHSYLKKTAILASVAIALAVAGWTILILYLTKAAFR